jgi:hypothetical protein
MSEMSYKQACEYVEKTKKNAFAVLPDGSEITLNWNEDDVEIWSTYLNILDENSMEEDFYPSEDLVKEFPDVEEVIWREGVGLFFASQYGVEEEPKECVCCKKESEYSILLAVAPDDETGLRYYIPNQIVRNTEDENLDLYANVVHAVWFCHECMRKVEDNLRETIATLQKQNAG